MERELGERLRSYRVDAGLEIDDLAARTRIGVRHLTAIEEGRLDELPGLIFVRGFVASVCRELGRDPAPLMELIDGLQVEEPVEESEGPYPSRRITPLLISGVILFGLVTGGILIHGGGEKSGGVNTTETTEGPQVAEEGRVTGEEYLEALPEEPVSELDLLIRATEKTWLRIQADASEPWETTMKTGDEIRLKAMERINLFIGNAGGILFELNGRRFGPPGSQGQVISSYVITRDNL